MSKRLFFSKILFPTAIAVTVSYFLLSQISIQSIPETLGRLPILSLAIGLGLYCIFIWTKALRFRELLLIDLPVRQLFPILALYTFWGNLLPMRSGDLSYIYLMKRREQIDGTKSIASLILASFIDLALLIALMVGTGWALRSHLDGRLSYATLYLGPTLIGFTLMTLMGMACIAPKACVAIADYCTKPLLRWKRPFVYWFTNRCLAVVHELTRLRLNRRFFKVWGYSLISLGFRFGFQCYLVREMGIAVSVMSLLFALAFTNIFNLLPIQSVGNFGTIEAPFAWALMCFGASKEIALVSGFSLHLIILLYCLPLGAYGFIGTKRETANQQN
ncbi:MAG: lysylphosphatidylglycerol synthase transmembrane domain-containing protein [Candidatus Poribacteria bacterium]|nr:lysylphosphatidylglycerol synthase transmembrane domain-containing protein [Candidatus Poribacteria bacterium]